MDGEVLLKKVSAGREDKEMDMTVLGGPAVICTGALSPVAEQQNAAWSDRYLAALERYKSLDPHSQEALDAVAAGLLDWASGLPYRGYKPDGRSVAANRWGLGAERCIIRGLRSHLVATERKPLAERIGSEMADLLETARSLDFVCLAAQPDPKAEKRLTGTAQIQIRTFASFLLEIDLKRQPAPAKCNSAIRKAHKVVREPDTKLLGDSEENIIEALGRETMTGEALAKKTGYPFNSNFKNTLSSLRKRRILGNASPGYFLAKAHRRLLNVGQDKGQD